MIYRGPDWWDVGRQGSCVLYLAADHGSQGRSWLIERFKRRSLGIIHSSYCIRWFLWKILSMIALICNFRSKNVAFTENLPVERNNDALAETITVTGPAASR
jgi:hypothetical protein